MLLIDSHCHIDAPEFSEDRSSVLQRAHANGVSALVAPAVSQAGWKALSELAAKSDNPCGIFPAYGLHPMFLLEHRREHIALLEGFIRGQLEQGRAVHAIGECGLDFLEDLPADEQQWFFEQQLRLARDFDLPVIAHARRAHDQVYSAFRRFGIQRGVVHSFAGSEAQAEALFRQGICLGLGGPLTYPRAQRLRRIVSTMPLELLLLETDAPDQPLCGRQGARNEPAYLPEIALQVGELRGLDSSVVASTCAKNTARLFALPSFV